MLMMLKQTGALLELDSPEELWDPYEAKVKARRLAGEEMQDTESFRKIDLAFLSGEALPECWVDVHYRDKEWQQFRYDPVVAAATAGPINYYGA